MAFGPDYGGIIGDLSWFGLSGVGLAPFKEYAATVPHQAFMVSQMMFGVIPLAVLAPAVRTGRGETEGVGLGQQGPPHPADDGDRRRHPLVRVVRLQRRK